MIKILMCLLWGHAPFVKLETVVHPPRSFDNLSELNCGGGIVDSFLKTMRGSTTVSLLCPRCGRIKVIEQ